MKKSILVLASLSLLFAISCGDDDSVGNKAPGAFEVTVSNIGANEVTLTWTESIDPDGDEVTYLGVTGTTGFTGSESLTTSSSFAGTLSGLAAETEYEGDIQASDEEGKVTTASFSFTTLAEGS